MFSNQKAFSVIIAEKIFGRDIRTPQVFFRVFWYWSCPLDVFMSLFLECCHLLTTALSRRLKRYSWKKESILSNLRINSNPAPDETALTMPSKQIVTNCTASSLMCFVFFFFFVWAYFKHQLIRLHQKQKKHCFKLPPPLYEGGRKQACELRGSAVESFSVKLIRGSRS